jgi:D-sedoheptulose 7-phosphate isomerase
MKPTLDDLITRHPRLDVCREDIQKAYDMLLECARGGRTILVCGNGGSAADSEHIVGELMKGFLEKRPVGPDLRQRLEELDPETGSHLASSLQMPIRAVSLTGHLSLSTAFNNDVSADCTFAQQVLGFGKAGDVLIGLTTSGNSQNVVNAVLTARALGMKSVGFTGEAGGKLGKLADICIRVPETETALVQELHLPVYHTLCAMLEDALFTH